MSYLHTEIDRVRIALRRHEAVVDAMYYNWKRNRMPCCPSCAFGSAYSDAINQCERTRRWLAVLLSKRGRPEDLSERKRLDFDGLGTG